jgi:hypothetical protein
MIAPVLIPVNPTMPVLLKCPETVNPATWRKLRFSK